VAQPSLAARVALLPRELCAGRELLGAALRRELAARLSGTLLGPLWPFLAPLALALGYGLLFTRVFGLDPVRASSAAESAAYVVSGVLVWSGCSEALARAAQSVLEQRGLIQKVAYPAGLLPLVPVLASLVLSLAGLAVGRVAWSAFGGAAPALPSLACAVPLLVVQAALLYGLALAFAALNALVRDVQHALAIALTFGLFATPVFWSARALELDPALAALVAANPFASLVEAWRGVLFAAPPGEILALVLRLAPWSAAALVGGAAVFGALRGRFADEA